MLPSPLTFIYPTLHFAVFVREYSITLLARQINLTQRSQQTEVEEKCLLVMQRTAKVRNIEGLTVFAISEPSRYFFTKCAVKINRDHLPN